MFHVKKRIKSPLITINKLFGCEISSFKTLADKIVENMHNLISLLCNGLTENWWIC